MRNAQRKGNYHDTSILCRINESSKQKEHARSLQEMSRWQRKKCARNHYPSQ